MEFVLICVAALFGVVMALGVMTYLLLQGLRFVPRFCRWVMAILVACSIKTLLSVTFYLNKGLRFIQRCYHQVKAYWVSYTNKRKASRDLETFDVADVVMKVKTLATEKQLDPWCSSVDWQQYDVPTYIRRGHIMH